MINYHSLRPIKWIFWVGLQTFVWLLLLDAEYDKHLLIYPKICCRLVSFEKNNCQMIVYWEKVDVMHTEFSKSNSILKKTQNSYSIIITDSKRKKVKILKVTLRFMNIWFINLYLTCCVEKSMSIWFLKTVHTCLFKMCQNNISYKTVEHISASMK
jgi:hypothetical protein